MIYQQIIAKLKELSCSTEAFMYASQNAFELQALADKGTSIDELVLICIIGE